MVMSLSIISVLLLSASTSAVSGSDWKAGRIIDDVIFYDNSSMNVSDIQSFMNSKVSNCDTNGTQPALDYGRSDLTHAQYAASQGWPAPPYICLKDYYQVPRSDQVITNFGNNVRPSGSISAAQIIKNAADTYSISPKALLVLLQKESPGPLLTDNWPLLKQYKNAMGYGCPDTAPCDPAYEGFYNQMTNAARQFKLYKDNPASYRYRPYQNNSIQYNPNINCGASNVYLENSATAGLYNYTPYQPNQSALNNLYGLGDGCGAYGNRNFWRMYNDWFGSTQAPDFRASYSSQSAYPTIHQGENAYISLSYINNGNSPWYDSSTAGAVGQQPVVLATTRPINRCSDFAAPSWSSCNRPSGLFSKVYEADGVTLATNQHVVRSGQIARYDFTMLAPQDSYAGTFKEFFAPIREGAPGFSWFMGADYVSMNITVLSAYSGSYVSQSSNPTIQQNDKTNAFVRFKNTGLYPWYDTTSVPAGQQPITLATDSDINRQSQFSSGWPYGTRPANTFSGVYNANGVISTGSQHIVQPGQIAEFSFPFTAKLGTTPGNYHECFSFIREGARNWQISNAATCWDIAVKQSSIRATYSSQSNYPTIAKGTSAQVHFIFKNSGNVNWYDNTSVTSGISPIHLATFYPINKFSSFADVSWATGNRPNYLFTGVYESDSVTPSSNQHIVQPGQLAKFSFLMTVNSTQQSGNYKEYFMPIAEGAPGYAWNTGVATWLQVIVP